MMSDLEALKHQHEVALNNLQTADVWHAYAMEGWSSPEQHHFRGDSFFSHLRMHDIPMTDADPALINAAAAPANVVFSSFPGLGPELLGRIVTTNLNWQENRKFWQEAWREVATLTGKTIWVWLLIEPEQKGGPYDDKWLMQLYPDGRIVLAPSEE
jgi:hypothetical protein